MCALIQYSFDSRLLLSCDVLFQLLESHSNFILSKCPKIGDLFYFCIKTRLSIFISNVYLIFDIFHNSIELLSQKPKQSFDCCALAIFDRSAWSIDVQQHTLLNKCDRFCFRCVKFISWLCYVVFFHVLFGILAVE